MFIDCIKGHVCLFLIFAERAFGFLQNCVTADEYLEQRMRWFQLHEVTALA